MLFILFTYYFTIIAFIFFTKFYGGRCENMYICTFETFDQSFKVIDFKYIKFGLLNNFYFRIMEELGLILS